jgi:N-acetylglutamate synthase-like GNAT family acetyltransferase
VRDESGVVGCVGLEIHDEAGILRSLAVVPERRGRGFGWMLADSAVNRARAIGLRRLYLLTESATDFFAEKFGFRAIDRATVDQSVTSTRHFRESKGSMVAMRLDL